MRFKTIKLTVPKKNMGLIQLDNITELSGKDRSGERYSANFEFYPFYEGQNYSLYKGVLNGSSFIHRRHGHMCVVRTFRNKCAESESDWEAYLQIARETEILILAFNKCVGRKVFSFVTPLLTYIEQKSSFVSLFRLWKPHEKHFKPDEYVVLEPYIQGHFRCLDANKPAKSEQKVRSEESHNIQDKRRDTFLERGCHGKKSISSKNVIARVPSSLSLQLEGNPDPELAAFGHYTWHKSEKFVITNLRGVFDHEKSCYKLVTPIIHSVSRGYGGTDEGTAGIIDFFDHHVCNSICYAWRRYEEPDSNCVTAHVTQPRSSLNQPD